jgi:hypothetical protein
MLATAPAETLNLEDSMPVMRISVFFLIIGLAGCSDATLTEPANNHSTKPAPAVGMAQAYYPFARIVHAKGWALASALPGGFTCSAEGSGFASYGLKLTLPMLDRLRTAISLGWHPSIDLMTGLGFHYGGFSRIDEKVTIDLNHKVLTVSEGASGYNNPGSPGIWEYPIHGHSIAMEDLEGFTEGAIFRVTIEWRATAIIPNQYCGQQVYGALAQARVVSAPALQIAP